MLNLSTNILGIPKALFQYALAGFAVIAAFAGLGKTLLPERATHD